MIAGKSIYSTYCLCPISVFVRPFDALARDINYAHGSILEAASSMLKWARRAGEFLIEAKKQCPHGTFKAWVEANCRFSYRQAAKYMRIAKCAPQGTFDPSMGINAFLDQFAEERTTNALSTFTFECPVPGFKGTIRISLRTVTIGGAPWFSGADVCNCLGRAVTNTSYDPLDAGEKQVIDRQRLPLSVEFWGRANKAVLISESGLYKLILRSDKPQAKPFQDWVTKVVLPAIRKDGAYIMGEEKVATGELSASTSTPGIRLHFRYQ
ncbi:hypothetical protein KL86APRO_30236 [uncultured Alphaproteobacteria bacterium]|uniref:Bro-N domain-containing protein n=1 Tax=uncultured Alphaproteobacteria bacterium TaxID=91750 RepID=A0A212KMD5_9PROT|nr:hypothetical protein KL86APRO_30236 [uncultured Alphaproteobacteria bacterium]